MAVLQMQRISICALKKNRKAILETVQNLGLIEVDQKIEEDADFQKTDTTSSKSSFEKVAASTDRALEILQNYAPVKTGVFSSLEGKPLAEEEFYKNVVANQEKLQNIVTRILALDKERAKLKSEIIKMENSMESLRPWIPLDVPMNCKGTKLTAMLLGTLPNEWKLEEIYQMLSEKLPEIKGIDVQILSSGTEGTYLTVICMKTEEDLVENALRSSGFAKPAAVWEDTPDNVKFRLWQQIKRDTSRMEEAKKEILSFCVERKRLQLLSDYYRVRAEKYEVLGQIVQSNRTFVIQGYVPKQEIVKIEKALSGYDCAIDIEDLKEEEDAPVLLSNHSFFGITEGILEAYGLPGRKEIDPTAVMTVFYIFLFGLMLADAAYGAIIFLVCGIFLLKFPRMERGMKKAFQLFFWCGLSTTFWGLMFGGFFGDLITVFSRTFLGKEILWEPMWFAPLDDPMRLLIWSMIFGIVHLFAGLAMKAIALVKNHRYLDAVLDVGLWAILLIGLILLLIPTDIFASILGKRIVFPEEVNTLAKVLACGGAAGILLTAGRTNRNIGLRIALGAYDLYNVTSWLSDLLSYSRLLALGLASGVIANVVNQMGSMFGDSILGLIGFIFVFVIGHTMNLAINLLGAYVHTNRLQYVEFFGKFYEGGGRRFHPFRANTKYAEIKEETKS